MSYSKFRNIKTAVDGIIFDSDKEANRFIQLKLLERGGKIRQLELQPCFSLVVDGILICKYFADFGYFEDNKRVIEDVKSEPTKTPVYRIKRKLLLALNPGLDHREIT